MTSHFKKVSALTFEKLLSIVLICIKTAINFTNNLKQKYREVKEILFLGLIVSSLSVKSQTVAELQEQITILKQQNQVLQEKVDFCDLYNNSEVSDTKSFNSNFELKVIECKGNSIEQTVELAITIKHSLPHQYLKLYTWSKKPIAYSETGSNYEFKSASFPGATSTSFYVPTNLLIQGKLIFRNVLPQTEKLSLINGTFRFENKDGGGNSEEGEFEIRNLNINWN